MRKDLSGKPNISNFRHIKYQRPTTTYYTEEDGTYIEEESQNTLYKRNYVKKEIIKDIWDDTKSKYKKILIKKIGAKKIAIGVAIVIGTIFLLLLMASIISIIFGATTSDYSLLASQCPTVEVINTDCIDGECSNKYDGEVEFEDYIAGVVAAKSGTSQKSIEYYKTEAVSARTYYFNNFNFSCEVEGNSNYQPYIDVEDSPYSDIIKQAVQDTRGEAIIEEEQNSNQEDDSPSISQTEALYLIEEQNYTYKEVIKHYYGQEAEIKNVNTSNSQSVNGFINPVNNSSCTSAFECRVHPIYNTYDSHSGLDLGAAPGTPIYAAKSGRIVSVTKTVPGYSDVYSYGNNILIDHGDNTKTRYAHLLYGSIPNNIVVGATVKQGEVIGQVGATGTVTGPHLHYEVYIYGNRTNPVNYIDLSNIGNTGQCNTNNIPLSYCGL